LGHATNFFFSPTEREIPSIIRRAERPKREKKKKEEKKERLLHPTKTKSFFPKKCGPTY